MFKIHNQNQICPISYSVTNLEYINAPYSVREILNVLTAYLNNEVHKVLLISED